MRVVIAVHSPIGSNSGRHVDGFARHLAARGVEVVVAVPTLEDGDAEAARRYALVGFDEALHRPAPASCTSGRPGTSSPGSCAARASRGGRFPSSSTSRTASGT